MTTTRIIVAATALLIVLGGWGTFSKMGAGYGKMGAASGGKATPPLKGKLLLESGGFFLLLEDGSSKLCFEGGC